MQYHIDTIPVWDAIKLNGECPLCALRRKNELMDVDRFLGASVMEPDTRILVNQKGFCGHHLSILFDQKNRLGLALMLHTHMKEASKTIQNALSKANEVGKQSGNTLFKRLLKGSAAPETPLQEAAGSLNQTASTCVLCDSINEHMKRYLYTTLYLWERDKDFRKAFSESKGVCIPHAAQLLSMAEDNLPQKELDAFIKTLSALVNDSLDRITKELEWFTLKFDYRNQDKPWGTSKDAIERASNKLRGFCTGDEPWPDK